jgi:hypothetical protein
VVVPSGRVLLCGSYSTSHDFPAIVTRLSISFLERALMYNFQTWDGFIVSPHVTDCPALLYVLDGYIV